MSKISKIQPSSPLLTVMAALLLLSSPAQAQTKGQPAETDLMPPVTAQSAASLPKLEAETHPVLNLSPDKSELVPLDREAHSVIVGNSSHVAVLLDTPKLAVVVPRTAGATYFTVLDKNGDVVMQRHVVVSAPKKNYVRVRRSCGNAADGQDCKPTSVYFCPDMCHEIGTASGDDASASGAAAE